MSHSASKDARHRLPSPLAGEGGAIGRRRTPVFRRAMAPDEGSEPMALARRPVRARGYGEYAGPAGTDFRAASIFRLICREPRLVGGGQRRRDGAVLAVIAREVADEVDRRGTTGRKVVLKAEAAHNINCLVVAGADEALQCL